MFYRKTQSARKIIVVDLGFLGDTIHLIPALWEIKCHYPQAQLQVLTTPLGCEVLDLARCVDRAWAFPLGPQSPPWWRHWDILRALRRERFDLAFNFSGADRTIFITTLTGAKWRIAYRGARRHFWSKWLIPNWVERIERDLPVYEKRRLVLDQSGLSLAAPKFDLTVPDEARRWADENVPNASIHLSINASTPLKEWPLPNWIELTQMLLKRYPDRCVIATGSARDREQARLGAFEAAAESKRVKVFRSGLKIAQLAALLSRCQLHVGADSGVLHLAMALGVPTVSIFREYAGLAEWAPQGSIHRRLVAKCPCADQRVPPCADSGKAVCLSEISAANVAEQVEAGLNHH